MEIWNPAGKPKTIAVDLSAVFSASREVRIRPTLCIYWDEIFLVRDAPPARLTPVRTVSADLHFRGFSKVDPERKQPEMLIIGGGQHLVEPTRELHALWRKPAL